MVEWKASIESQEGKNPMPEEAGPPILMEYFLDGDCIIPFYHVFGAFFHGISRDGDVNRGQSWKQSW